VAAASYTTDLVDWILDSDTTAWTELTNAASGGAPDEVDTESALQGTNSCSQITNTTALCSLIRILATPITLSAGQVFLMWHGHGVATALQSYANGGLRTVVSGNAVGNWKAWAVGGNDVAPFPYAKWVSTPIDPTVTADYTNGTPPTGGTNIYGVGSMCILTQAVARGQPHIVDIIRYGRAEARMNGGDLANGYATFAGFAAQNDTSANRWGLIQSVTGGYQWKGLMTLGHGSAVDFRDSNTALFVQDCRKVTATFNKIEVRQAGSRVDWTNISITNSSPTTNVSPGDFEVIDDADVNFNGCTFTDMGTWIFKPNSTVNDVTFRRCGQVTLGGATMTDCVITRSTATTALLAGSSVSTLSNTSFTSDGTGHAIEITGGTSHTLNNITFSGYAASNGSTGNEAVYVNIASGNVTINSDSAISVRTAGATVTVVAGQKTLTVTGIVSGSDVVILTAGTDTVLAINDGATNPVTSFAYSYTYSAGVNVDVAVYKAGYVPYIVRAYLLENGNASLPVAQVVDRNYTP
jgi:hypothetical protein